MLFHYRTQEAAPSASLRLSRGRSRPCDTAARPIPHAPNGRRTPPPTTALRQGGLLSRTSDALRKVQRAAPRQSRPSHGLGETGEGKGSVGGTNGAPSLRRGPLGLSLRSRRARGLDDAACRASRRGAQRHSSVPAQCGTGSIYGVSAHAYTTSICDRGAKGRRQARLAGRSGGWGGKRFRIRLTAVTVLRWQCSATGGARRG